MNLIRPYAAATRAVGRPERELRPIYPHGWTETDRPCAMLVLVGGKALAKADEPTVALVLGRGTYALGGSIRGAAFPKSPSMPRVFEGHQCALHVGDDVRILEDFSTNGTLVIPAAEVRKVPSLRIDDALRKKWNRPCPVTVHSNDVVLTMYAELLLVLL